MTPEDRKENLSDPGGRDPKAGARRASRNPVRRLYDWVLGWADSRYGIAALFVLAFLEASVFPVPPDVLLIALALGSPKKAFRFAGICTAGSVLGGIAGYTIGYFAAPLAKELIASLAGTRFYYQVAQAYGDNAFLSISIAGFTPIPYKVFTLAAGVFHDTVPLWILVAASLFSRSARFFLVSGLLFAMGPSVKKFIDRWFNLLALAFGLLLVGGFLVLGWSSRKGQTPEAEKAAAIFRELRHSDPELRRIAFQELKEIAEKDGAAPDFGFDPQAAPEANEEAVRRWEEWWKGKFPENPDPRDKATDR